MGSWTEAAAVLRLRRKAKQVRLQERVYVAHAKSAERLVVAALLVSGADCPITIHYESDST